jgi:hypothetical protein
MVHTTSSTTRYFLLVLLAWRLVWLLPLVCALALAGILIWRLVPIYQAQGEEQALNPVFASAENLQEPGVRLRSLTLEAAEGSLRLEYDLESMVKASAITDLLNTGFEQRPWQLESVSGSADIATVGGMPMPPTTSGFRGAWTVQLKKL